MTVKHLFPEAEPALNLDFRNSLTLDPRVSYSRASTGTYVGRDRLLHYAQQNEPRFDHDSVTGESLGLLVEMARTNLVIHSEDLSAGSWSPLENAALSTVAGVTAPDGASAVYRLTENSSTSPETHGISVAAANMNGGSDPGIDFTVSFWARSSNRGVRVRALGFGNFTFYFDIADVSGNRDAQIQSGNLIPFPNGWYKCVYTGNIQGNRRLSFQSFIESLPTPGEVAYGGDGLSFIELWGIQAEQGQFGTSYIPTSGPIGGSVCNCRAADVFEMTGTDFSDWYYPPEGSLSVGYVANGGFGLLRIWDGQGNNLNYWEVGAKNAAGGVLGFTTRSNQGAGGIGTYNKGRIDAQNNYGFRVNHAAAIGVGESSCYTFSSSGDVNLNTGSLDPGQDDYLAPLVDRFELYELAGSLTIAYISYYRQRLSDEQLLALAS